MSDYDAILSAASQLPADQQLRLIDELWGASIESSAAPLHEDWQKEINRRTAQLDAGEVESIAWETVRDAALKRAGARRAD